MQSQRKIEESAALYSTDDKNLEVIRDYGFFGVQLVFDGVFSAN